MASYQVSGAGNSSYNGIYTEAGTYNSQPYYSNGTMYLYWNTNAGGAWCLNSALNNGMPPGSNSAYLNTSSITGAYSMGSVGTAPAPTVSTYSGDGLANPTCNITSPTNGQAVGVNWSVSITATATQSGGSISQVQFYQGATLIGTATSSPYTINWTPGAAGSYSLTATATAADGKTGTSSAVTIVAQNPQSYVS